MCLERQPYLQSTTNLYNRHERVYLNLAMNYKEVEFEPVSSAFNVRLYKTKMPQLHEMKNVVASNTFFFLHSIGLN